MIIFSKDARFLMETGHKITLDIPDELSREIADFKKRSHIKSVDDFIAYLKA